MSKKTTLEGGSEENAMSQRDVFGGKRMQSNSVLLTLIVHHTVVGIARDCK